MNKLFLLLLVGLAIAVGYSIGTEDGRRQRDQLIEAINRRRGKSTIDVDLSEATEGIDLKTPTAQPA